MAHGPTPALARPKAVDAAAQWRFPLTALTAALLLFEAASGLAVYLLPFGEVAQFGLLTHVLLGIPMLVPVGWFVGRHWRVRRSGAFNHFQLLGYLSLLLLVVCAGSGLVLAWQGIAGPAIDRLWDFVHLSSGLAVTVFLVVHLGVVAAGKRAATYSERSVRPARRAFYLRATLGAAVPVALWLGWGAAYAPPALEEPFVADYNWRFGEDRPFAPSLARLDRGDWLPELHREVAEVLPQAERPGFLAAVARRTSPSVGPLGQVRAAVAGLNLEPASSARIDALLDEALTHLRRTGAVASRVLAGSDGCGAPGCHEQIYREWLPSAHRYSALDPLFQRVQEIMVDETAPEYTRYCAGCHDPISLFNGAKTPANLTLSAEGAREGTSCVVCHAIVQTDIQGNGDYALRPPTPYVYEWDDRATARFVRDFLIRTYPWQHLRDYDRPLLRQPEFCAACHKQYVDREINRDIGKVQGQNQYDSWKGSRWYHEDDPRQTVTCRECHMPLAESEDPARGDASDYNRAPGDGKHRSHSMLGANQYVPVEQGLDGGQEHARLVEQWLRGEIPIPEIAHKWTTGAAIRLDVRAPAQAVSGERIRVQVMLDNNKAGHDFPTGPLDMIESWLELQVRDSTGRTLLHHGAIGPGGEVGDTPVVFKADGFDREHQPIDRHNLWDLVGVDYKRSLYPGMTDTVDIPVRCPSLGTGNGTSPGTGWSEEFAVDVPATFETLEIEAALHYRKANPAFLDRIYGAQRGERSPITEIARAVARVEVRPRGE